MRIDYIRHFPWIAERLIDRVEVVNLHTRELPPEAAVDRASAEAMGMKSFLTIPLLYDGAVRYLISTNAVREERVWPAEYLPRLRLIGEIFVNALMREQADRFERLLSEISARFVNLPSDQVDSEIRDTQILICECLGLERCSLFQVSGSRLRVLHLSHLYQAPDSPPVPEQPDVKELFPWLSGRCLPGEAVLLSKLEDLPPEAATDKANLQRVRHSFHRGVPAQGGRNGHRRWWPSRPSGRKGIGRKTS